MLLVPIKIDALGAVQGYLVFEDCGQTLTGDEKHLTFRVHTNRGNPIRLKVPLCNWVSPEKFA